MMLLQHMSSSLGLRLSQVADMDRQLRGPEQELVFVFWTCSIRIGVP